MKNKIIEYGNDALFEVGVTKLDSELVDMNSSLEVFFFTPIKNISFIYYIC